MTDTVCEGRLVLQGRIDCVSPVHVGSGMDANSDMDVLVDHEQVPFIPATSLVGVLRHTIGADERVFQEHPDPWRRFWGYAEGKEGHQSLFQCADLTLEGAETPSIIVRDGIRLCGRTGMVIQGAKYDFEILEPGSSFWLNATFTITPKDRAFILKMAATIIGLLRDQRISVGAKTNSGLGRIRLATETIRLFRFDFSPEKRADVFAWLRKDYSRQAIPQDTLPPPFEIRTAPFRIRADFSLASSLLIRSYSEDPKLPDAVAMKSDGKWVIPGTSMKGAIRARAERIVHTLDRDPAILTRLFGEVNEEKAIAHKGHIRIDETTLTDPNAYASHTHTRIKTDRFTGGTIEGALFETMPVYAQEDAAFTVSMRISDFDGKEAGLGLLLLVLKDLWAGDLAVGGEKSIGRGVLRGKRATIAIEDRTVTIGDDIHQLAEEDKRLLQSYVEKLNAWTPKG